LRQVGGRVRRGEMHRQAAPREGGGYRRGDGGLAHAALPHDHDQAVAVGGYVVDEIDETRRGDGMDRLRKPGEIVGVLAEKTTQCRHANEVEWLESDVVSRQRLEDRRHRLERRLLAARDGRGERVVADRIRWEYTVHHEVVVGDADRGELLVGAGDLVERGALSPRH